MVSDDLLLARGCRRRGDVDSRPFGWAEGRVFGHVERLVQADRAVLHQSIAQVHDSIGANGNVVSVISDRCRPKAAKCG